MATKKPMKKPVKRVRRFQEGGEAADKMAGLAASNKDAPMGFFERLRMGNIDQEGSQAYNRLGAGRAKMDRDAASELAANRMVDEARSAKGISNYQQSVDQDEADRGAEMRNYEMMQRGRAEGERDEKRMAPSSVAQTQNAAILAAKPSRTASGKTTGDFTRLDRKALLPSGPNVARDPGGVGKRRAASSEDTAASFAASAAAPRNDASATPTQSASAPNESKFDASDALGVGLAAASVIPVVRGGRVLYQAGKKMYQTYKAAKDAVKKSSPSGVTGVMPSKYIYTGAKKGGIVKKMAHGGSVKSPVSTASKRGDGIAQRGKTRGKIY